jgi:sugar O-acyltransferase (sialic acid O-acetyltransferase NeuD family)
VLGAGGHAKVVIDLLLKLRRSVPAALEPEASERARWVLGVPVKSEHLEMPRHSPDRIELALGIGMPTRDPISGLVARRALAARYQARGYHFPTLIHPGAIIGAECTFGEGAQVMAGAVVQPSCTIAQFVIINTGARIDHDCILGDGCHVAPGATLGGAIRVGRETLIGIGAAVSQRVEIGERALIAGGAMVIDNVRDNERRLGVPARG